MARELRNLLVNEIHDRSLRRAAVRASGRMLDIGCGTKPYASMFAPHVTEHVGLDHPDSLHGTDRVDLAGTAYDIPAEDGSFDTVLCTAVLEHLEEPAAALRESRRVLRPGGLAIYSAPFIWHLHEEPRDFFRYSKYGLTHLFVQAGFEIESIEPLAGFWVTFGQLLVYYLQRFERVRLVKYLRLPLLAGFPIQAGAALLDRLDRAEGWTWAYMVCARSPEEG